MSANNHITIAHVHLPLLLSYYPQEHGRHPMSVQQSSMPLLKSIDPVIGERPQSHFENPHSFFVNFTVEHWATGNVHVEAHSLSRPCLICFDARARIESSSSITFITTSVIIEVCGKESSACTS